MSGYLVKANPRVSAAWQKLQRMALTKKKLIDDVAHTSTYTENINLEIWDLRCASFETP